MSFSWSAADGEIFSGEEWMPAAPVRGRLVCVHGLGGAASDFLPLGQAALRQGFGCLAPNLRGQGCDPNPNRRGRFLDPEVLVRDLAGYVNALGDRRPEQPLFLCGESLGALLVAKLLGSPLLTTPVAGAVFSVPVVDLKKPTPAIVRQILRVLSQLLPGLRLNPARFVSRKRGKGRALPVTRDRAHEEFLLQAPHRIPVFSVAVLNAMGQLMDDRKNLAAGITVPALVLAAGQDVYVRPDQIRSWYDDIPETDKKFREYPEAYHLLWNDLDREEVLGDIVEWLECRLAVC